MFLTTEKTDPCRLSPVLKVHTEFLASTAFALQGCINCAYTGLQCRFNASTVINNRNFYFLNL